MQQSYRPWLPEAALKACTIDSLLADVARQWSARWFARLNARPLSLVAPLPSASRLDEWRWLVCDNELAIGIAGGARPILTGMMIDTSVPDGPLTDADRHVIDDLSSTCIDDLCRRMAELFYLDGNARWAKAESHAGPELLEPRACLIGVEARAPLVQILISTATMIRFAKASLPSVASQAPLAQISEGLAVQDVTVSASLGRCTLTLAELSELSTGDVLVFDHDAEAPLSLAVDGRPAPSLRCTLEGQDQRLRLKLLEPANR